MCGDSPDHVHHVRYPKNFKDDALENLIVLCASCHAKSHGRRGEEMTNAMVLNFDGRQVIACVRDGETLFRFREVFDALEYGEAVHAFNAVRNAFLPNQVFSSAWGRLPETCRREIREEFDGYASRVVQYVTEKGVYRMAMNSDSKKADRFQDWLAEVCMSIRQHGSYPPPMVDLLPKTPAEIVAAIAQSVVEMERQQATIISEQNRLEVGHEKLEQQINHLNQKFNSIEKHKIEALELIANSASRQAGTSRQRLLMLGLDPEANYHGSPLKTVVGKLAKSFCREKGISTEQIMEGTYRVNVYPFHVLDDAIRSLGLLH